MFFFQRRIQNSFLYRIIICKFRIKLVIIFHIKLNIFISIIFIFWNISITTVFNMVIIFKINKHSNAYQSYKNKKNCSNYD